MEYATEVELAEALATGQVNLQDGLLLACKKGWLQTVDTLVACGCVRGMSHSGIRSASRYGHVEIVRLLLPIVKDMDVWSACYNATFYGQFQVLRLLFTDDRADSSSVINQALLKNRAQIMRLCAGYSAWFAK